MKRVRKMNLTVTDLIRILQQYQTEIGCDGEKIGSHTLKSNVRFVISNPEIDLDLEFLPGCCPSGVVFTLKST